MTKEEFLDKNEISYKKHVKLLMDIQSPWKTVKKGTVFSEHSLYIHLNMDINKLNRYPEWFEYVYFYAPKNFTTTIKFLIWLNDKYSLKELLNHDTFDVNFNIYVEHLLKKKFHATKKRKIQKDNQQEH